MWEQFFFFFIICVARSWTLRVIEGLGYWRPRAVLGVEQRKAGLCLSALAILNSFSFHSIKIIGIVDCGIALPSRFENISCKTHQVSFPLLVAFELVELDIFPFPKDERPNRGIPSVEISPIEYYNVCFYNSLILLPPIPRLPPLPRHVIPCYDSLAFIASYIAKLHTYQKTSVGHVLLMSNFCADPPKCVAKVVWEVFRKLVGLRKICPSAASASN